MKVITKGENMNGKELRLKRIFRKEKILVLALDHGMGMGPQPGLIDPKLTITNCIKGGIDAVLTSPGIADMYANLFSDVSLIVRLDGGFTMLKGGIDRAVPCFSVEHAIRLGCDAVACMGLIGGNEIQEQNSLQALSNYVESCDYWQVPLMAEMIALKSDQKDLTEGIKASIAIRTGVEYGADFIKTPYVAEGDDFKHAVEGSFKPVLVLGGGKVNDMELLTSIKKALNEGALGAVIGRNIWQHKNPEKISKALSLIIHEDEEVERAFSLAGL